MHVCVCATSHSEPNTILLLLSFDCSATISLIQLIHSSRAFVEKEGLNYEPT